MRSGALMRCNKSRSTSDETSDEFKGGGAEDATEAPWKPSADVKSLLSKVKRIDNYRVSRNSNVTRILTSRGALPLRILACPTVRRRQMIKCPIRVLIRLRPPPLIRLRRVKIFD